MQRVLDSDEIIVDYETVETLEDFFTESYAKDILNVIPASNLFSLAINSREVPQYRRRKYFFEQIETYFLEGNDLDMKRKLGRFYRKYIKNR